MIQAFKKSDLTWVLHLRGGATIYALTYARAYRPKFIKKIYVQYVEKFSHFDGTLEGIENQNKRRLQTFRQRIV